MPTLALRFIGASVLGFMATAAAAQAPAPPKNSDRPFEILDNSFLIEEAFNQERGVVQNILFWNIDRDGKWEASFTQEWPAPGMKHQFSYTVPAARTDAGTGLNDVLLNYRYQLLEEGRGRPAIAPRLSLILPTGGTEAELGNGVVGLQGAMPASKQFGDLYLHGNVGWTWLPNVESQATATRVNLLSPYAGGSVIWRIAPMFNAMLESVVEFDETLDLRGRAKRARTVTASPGFRYGWNIGERQIVIGAAVPIVRSEGESAATLLTYFSYELPFKK